MNNIYITNEGDETFVSIEHSMLLALFHHSVVKGIGVIIESAISENLTSILTMPEAVYKAFKAMYEHLPDRVIFQTREGGWFQIIHLDGVFIEVKPIVCGCQLYNYDLNDVLQLIDQKTLH